MNLLRKLLRRPAFTTGCTVAVGQFLDGNSPSSVHRSLVAIGFSDIEAAKIVSFLPSAFARVYYRSSGYGFPDYFFSSAEDYKAGRSLKYSKEPIFDAALRSAEQMSSQGMTSQIEVMAMLSAEHVGILHAKSLGLTPTHSSAVIYQF